ncbi:MAG: BamA/TamA family outer membrane protein [Prevotella sp.]|nr:BamA/TamA family outer membrane protein [Prevotella sp.]
MKQNSLLLLTILLLASCSMTKNIPEGDQLFTGLTKITYEDVVPTDDTPAGRLQEANLIETQTEVEAALAAAPNGSLFGSSYHRVPFSLGVAVWNKYSGKSGGFAKWMTKALGKQPVLMSWVNPELRATVAQNVLHNHGYFSGSVGYESVPQKNPKTAKIHYTVHPGRLCLLDSVGYFGFPAEADSMIRVSLPDAKIRRGDPFVVANLEAERQRISQLLRNNGYYYYQPEYASYLADTFVVDGKAQLRFQMARDIPVAATHKWYIGRINVNMRKTFMEQPTDSFRGRYLTIRYAGKKPPIRPRVLLADMKLRPRQEYSYSDYLESASKINAMGLFSATEFTFTPRDTTAACDTLDLTLNCTFEKPWDVYIETNCNARTIGRIGPELRVGVTRRNAFRGGEKINVNLHGSYEWSTGSGSSMNNYEYGADASVEFPRIIAPFVRSRRRLRRDANGRPLPPRRFYTTPTTIAKASTNIIHRPSYYKMHVVSGEWTYRWQTSESSHHEFSPLTVKYQFMNSHTTEFDKLTIANPYLLVTMQDYCIPEMRYTYTYTSPSGLLHPVRWETTLSESGNVTSLAMLATGKSLSEKDKKLFKNPYSQFLKIETDFTKTWTLDAHSKLVGHVSAGLGIAFGNSDWLPTTELFYAGGANSIRAFAVRGIGPGRFPGVPDKAFSYLLQNGNVKLVGNLEYRRQLFGRLHGAVFLDAGNVWNTREQFSSSESAGIFDNTTFRMSRLLRDVAVGTGVGLRYDLDFLVVRLDWGFALHVPYDTGRSGYFNVERFSKAQTLHFAIGYPF